MEQCKEFKKHHTSIDNERNCFFCGCLSQDIIYNPDYNKELFLCPDCSKHIIVS